MGPLSKTVMDQDGLILLNFMTCPCPVKHCFRVSKKHALNGDGPNVTCSVQMLYNYYVGYSDEKTFAFAVHAA